MDLQLTSARSLLFICGRHLQDAGGTTGAVPMLIGRIEQNELAALCVS
jgi:hypothetical protein